MSKLQYSFPLIAMCTSLLGGCGAFGVVAGSGNVVTISADYVDFDALDISSAFDVHIVPDTEYSIAVQIDDNFEEYLELSQSGSSVHLGMRDMHSFDGTFRAEIHMPVLEAIALSGASVAMLTDDFTFTNLDINLSGASSLEGPVYGDTLTIDLSGASDLELLGTAADVDMVLAGASVANIIDLLVVNLTADLSGASEANVDVSNSITGDVSGASSLRYVGNPSDRNVETSGASSFSEM